MERSRPVQAELNRSHSFLHFSISPFLHSRKGGGVKSVSTIVHSKDWSYHVTTHNTLGFHFRGTSGEVQAPFITQGDTL